MLRVLILPAPSWCEHPLYPTRKCKSISSPAALGSASRTFGVSWGFIPSSLELWTLPFPAVSGFWGKCQKKGKPAIFRWWWLQSGPSWTLVLPALCLALMEWCCSQLTSWAGLAKTWAGVEWTLLPDPHIFFQGSCSLAQEPVGGCVQCSAGVPGQHSGEEVSGHPWNLVEIPFFSVICFRARSHSRTAATYALWWQRMYLFWSSPHAPFIFITKFKLWFILWGKIFSCSVKFSPYLSILSNFHRVSENCIYTPSEEYVFKPCKNIS